MIRACVASALYATQVTTGDLVPLGVRNPGCENHWLVSPDPMQLAVADSVK